MLDPFFVGHTPQSHWGIIMLLKPCITNCTIALFVSPLGVMTTQIFILSRIHQAELETVADDINALTTVEGFDGHNQAVKVRLNDQTKVVCGMVWANPRYIHILG